MNVMHVTFRFELKEAEKKPTSKKIQTGCSDS